MSDIQSISQGNYILQGTVATSAGIVGDGSPQNPLRADETVLWSGSRTSAIQTSESMKNFDKCQVYIVHGTYGPPQVYTIDFADMGSTGYFAITRPRGSTNLNLAYIRLTADDTHLAAVNAKCLAFGSWTTTATGVTATTGEAEDLNSIIKVVGINRKNNA